MSVVHRGQKWMDESSESEEDEQEDDARSVSFKKKRKPRVQKEEWMSNQTKKYAMGAVAIAMLAGIAWMCQSSTKTSVRSIPRSLPSLPPPQLPHMDVKKKKKATDHSPRRKKKKVVTTEEEEEEEEEEERR